MAQQVLLGKKWNKKSENVQCFFSSFFLLQKQHEGSECQKHDTAENVRENTVLNYQNNLSIYKMEKKKKEEKKEKKFNFTWSVLFGEYNMYVT